MHKSREAIDEQQQAQMGNAFHHTCFETPCTLCLQLACECKMINTVSENGYDLLCPNCGAVMRSYTITVTKT